jgi:hypothetical protein
MFKAKRDIRPNSLVLKNIKRLALFSLSSLFLLGQSAWAMITVVDGGHQKITAGSPSEKISFQVFDEQGTPHTAGTMVNFSLTSPSGQTITDGLSNQEGETKETGIVSTTMIAQDTVGNYTITATLATDSTQTATTSIVVVAGVPSQIKLLSGGDQTVTVGKISSSVIFQLTDASGNVVAKQPVSFQLQLPSGETTQTGIFPITAFSDSNGEVATRLEATETVGNYQIMAILTDNNSVTTNTSIQVTEELPRLPSLGAGMMVDPQGNLTSLNEVNFYGGTSVDDSPFNQEVSLQGLNNVLVQSVIDVAPAHVEQAAEIIVVGIQELALGQITLLMMNENKVEIWDGNLASLTWYFKIDSLAAKHFVNIYGGPLEGPIGRLQLYLGYRLEDGTLIFNGNKVIQISFR